MKWSKTTSKKLMCYTSLNGLILVCMIKGYLHNSQFFMSEL